MILFNLSGHGLIAMASYDQYLAGNLMNYQLKDEDIQKNLAEIKDMYLGYKITEGYRKDILSYKLRQTKQLYPCLLYTSRCV